ncbi:MAG: hypothetical protein AAGI46_06585 [Planctomycetota bacterium]
MTPEDDHPAASMHGLDVESLVELSRPAPSPMLGILPFAGLGCLVAALVTATALQSPLGMGIATGFLLGSLGSTFYMARLAQSARDERRAVRKIDELVTLRQWSDAATSVRQLMSRPMRLLVSRRAAVSLLARITSRYGDEEAAIELMRDLIDDPGTDPSTSFAARCNLAVLLLRTHRLGEANDTLDRLRGDMRRMQSSIARMRQADDASVAEEEPELKIDDLLDAEDGDGPPQASADVPPSPESFVPAALIVAEMYRDVQTNHHEEAIEAFEQHRPSLQRQLGVRFSDALALASASAERAGRSDDAAVWWSDATCLTPAAELLRRYPELADVASRHEGTVIPAHPLAGGGA